MKSVSLILRIVAILGAIAALAGYFMVKGKVAESKAELETKNNTITQLESDINSLGASKTAVENRISGMESELQLARQTTSEAQSRFSEARSIQRKAEAQLDATEKRVAQLQSDNQALRQELITKTVTAPSDGATAEEVEAMESRISELEAQLEDATQSRDRLERRVASLQSQATGVASATTTPGDAITIDGDGPTATNRGGPVTIASTVEEVSAPADTTPERPSGLSTRVPSIDSFTSSGMSATILKTSDRDGLLIINRGTSSGIASGQIFALAEGSNEPIVVRTSRVLLNYSVLSILPNQENTDSLDEGDEVVIFK